jgi:hypothetical protein
MHAQTAGANNRRDFLDPNLPRIVDLQGAARREAAFKGGKNQCTKNRLVRFVERAIQKDTVFI